MTFQQIVMILSVMTFQQIVMILSVLCAAPAVLFLCFASFSSGEKSRHLLGLLAYFSIILWFVLLYVGIIFIGIFGSPYSADAAIWVSGLFEGPMKKIHKHYVQNIHIYFVIGAVFLYTFFWKDLKSFFKS